MRCRLTVLAVSLLLAACSSPKPEANLLDEARAALGDVTSLEFSGRGSNGFFGQALTAGEPWPVRELKSFRRAVDYSRRLSTEAVEYADAGAFPMRTPPEVQEIKLWLTPHGFVKAAALSADIEVSGNTVAFTAPTGNRVTGTFDDQHRLTRAETKIADPVLGEAPLIISYSDYADRNGILFPGRIVEEQGGHMTWDLTVDSVTPNTSVTSPSPTETAQSVTATPTRLAEGVWHITGGSHHSLLVEFADFLTVVEAPQNEARANAVVFVAKSLVPDKPIRYVVSTHHHFDHSGGLRAFVAEGSTIVTHESNKDYFTRAFAGTPKPARFQTVAGKYVITDGTRNLEVHQIAGDTHTTELLVAYLPAERILVEADAYSPNDAAARPNPAPANAVNLYDKIVALGLNVSTIAPVHGRGAVPIAEFRRFVNK